MSAGIFHMNQWGRCRDAVIKKVIGGICLFAAALFCGVLLAVAAELFFAERQEKTAVREQVRAVVARQADEKVKKVALTFDDGPNPEYTPKLLDGLSQRQVQVTFFVLGEEAESYPKLIQRAAAQGHLIGVHAYRHVNLRQLSVADAKAQIEKTNQAIVDACGVSASYVRPPYGCWNEKLDDEVQMVEVLWDVDPRDWATSSCDLVVQRVKQEVCENSIILLHDASESSVQAAFCIIDELQAEGYTFVTVEELLME